MRIQDVQAVLGHSDLRVTSVYIKARMEDVVRGMRSLERARSGQGKEASRS
jgi:site-specific recombinase XerD